MGFLPGCAWKALSAQGEGKGPGTELVLGAGCWEHGNDQRTIFPRPPPQGVALAMV